MYMVRMNITMPERVAQKLDKVKNKSRFIAEAVEEKMNALEKQKLLARLEEEYKEMAKESMTIMKDWEVVDREGWK